MQIHSILKVPVPFLSTLFGGYLGKKGAEALSSRNFSIIEKVKTSINSDLVEAAGAICLLSFLSFSYYWMCADASSEKDKEFTKKNLFIYTVLPASSAFIACIATNLLRSE